jgi:hypothetical protein
MILATGAASEPAPDHAGPYSIRDRDRHAGTGGQARSRGSQFNPPTTEVPEARSRSAARRVITGQFGSWPSPVAVATIVRLQPGGSPVPGPELGEGEGPLLPRPPGAWGRGPPPP